MLTVGPGGLVSKMASQQEKTFCVLWTPPNGAHRKPFSCYDATLETGPAVSMRGELLVAHEKLGQLPLLTVYVVPV
jgi:hypothetical protein